MSKQITLEDLTSSSKPTNSTESHIPIKKAEAPQKFTSSEVADIMRKSGQMKPKEEVVEDAPVFKNAMNALDETINGRIEYYENNVKPIIEENAREMALEMEIGENSEDNEINVSVPKIPEQDSLPSEDDFSELDDNELLEEKNTDESVINKNYNFDGKKEKESKKEESKDQEQNKPSNTDKKESVKEESTEDESIEEEEESGSLDEFMDDLDKEDSYIEVDDEDDEEDEESPEEIREKFKKEFESVKITNDPIDLNKFKIRNKTINSNLVLANLKNNRVLKKADWTLYKTRRTVTFTECTGPELDALRKTLNASNGLRGVIESLRFIYNHIEDANKPIFENWCKLIRTEDIESLYFGIYKACYSSSNLITRQCIKDSCKKMSLINTDINAMVKFGDDSNPEEAKAIKEEFENIYNNKDTTTSVTEHESTLFQISDDIVIAYSPATLYSTFIQFSSFKQDLATKYADLLNIMAYIDEFFIIDRETQELVPISIKTYNKQFNKTVLERLKVFTGILKSLTADQYNVLTAKLSNLVEPSKISYVLPKCTCPECGTTIDEEPVDSMLNLLFIRAQLAQVKSL